MAERLELHPTTPQVRLLRLAADCLLDGGVIAYPTDSCYALGCAIGAKQAMERIGLSLPRSGYARSLDEARMIIRTVGYPALIRPSFTLGGTGASIAYNPEELEDGVRWGLQASPVSSVPQCSRMAPVTLAKP